MNQRSSEENYTANTRAWKSSAASTSQYQHPLSSQEVAKVARQLFFKEEKTETQPEEPSFGSSEEKNRLSNKTHESSHRGSITSLGRDFVSAGSFRTSPDKEEADHYPNSSNPRNQDLKGNPNQFRNAEQNPQYYQNNANNTFTSQDPDSPFAPQKSQTTNYQDYPNANNQMNGQRNFPFSHQQTSSFQQQQQQSEHNQYQNRPVNTQSYHSMPNNNYPVAHSYNPSIHNYSIHGTIPADLNASYMSSVSQTSKKRVKPIVVMNINIGNGKKEEINIFEGDNPFEVAYTFCMRYNLPGNLQQVLAQNIQTQVNTYYATRTQKKIPNAEPQDLRQIVTQQSQHQHHQSLVQPQSYQNYNYPADIDPRMSERASQHQPQPHEYSPKPTLEESMSHRSTVNEGDVRSSPKNANQMNKQYQQYEQEEHHHQDFDENNGLAIEEIEAQIKQLEKQRATYLNKPGTGRFAQQELRSGTFVSSTTGNNVNAAPKQAAQNKNKLFLNNVDAPAQETFGSYVSQSTKHAGEKPNIHDRLYEEAKHRRAGSKSPARGGTGGTSYSYTKVGKEPVTSTSYGKLHQEKKAAANQRPEPRVQDTADKSPKSFRATASKSPVNRPITPTRQAERESSNTLKPAPVNKPTPVYEKKESIKNVSIAPETNKVVYSEPGNGQYVVAQPRSTNSNAENYRMSQKEATAAPPRQSTVDRNELTRKVLEEIFRSLDDDFDGKISSENVYTKGLGPNIIESLSEVFWALDGGMELNFLDFTNIVNQKKLLDAINNVYEFDYAPEQETSSKTKPVDSNTPRNLRSEEERQFYSPKESIGSKDSPSTAYTAYEDDKSRNPKSILKQPSFEGPEDTTPITSKYKQIAAKHFANKK